MKRWEGRGVVLLVGIILLGLLVVGALIVRSRIVRRSRDEFGAFESQSTRLAITFARAADAWLERGNWDAINESTALLLAGSADFVAITMESVVILDKREEGAVIPEIPAEVSDEGALLQPMSDRDRGVLHVFVPIDQPGRQDEADRGVVQVGFSDSHAAGRVREYGRFVVLLAIGAWIAVAVACVLVGRLVLLKRKLAETGMVEETAALRCGSLLIDTEGCLASLNGADIDLTPKMFELLAFLARHPGKTFSDAQLLEALWADAPYAASGDVKQCIYMLRRRLGALHPDPKAIVVNVKGFGYRLDPPTEMAMKRD